MVLMSLRSLNYVLLTFFTCLNSCFPWKQTFSQKRILCIELRKNVLLWKVGPFRTIICHTGCGLGIRNRVLGGKEKKLQDQLSSLKIPWFLYQLMERGARGQAIFGPGVGFNIVSTLNMIIKRMLLYIWRIYGLLDIGQYWFRWQLFTGIAGKASCLVPEDYRADRLLGPVCDYKHLCQGEEAKSVVRNEASTPPLLLGEEKLNPPVNLWSGPPRILG